MTQADHEPTLQEDRSRIERGEILISRYLQSLLNLLAGFLDRSSPRGVALARFHQDASHACFLEFNAPFHTALTIERARAGLFGCEPNSRSVERYDGEAGHCLQLSRKRGRAASPKPQLGLSPRSN